jgi:PIN domain nuclease of toxin-antitoxin system
VKYLLDTHVLLWWLDGESPLPAAVRHQIDDSVNEIVVSVATIWEIAIKKALGKLQAPDDLLDILEQNNMAVLPLKAQHAQAISQLPALHNDPFDRMLVIQAYVENLMLVTRDKAVQAYCGSFAPPCLKV